MEGPSQPGRQRGAKNQVEERKNGGKGGERNKRKRIGEKGEEVKREKS